MLPREIIIIRHGEKTEDKNFFGLSQKGLARSIYLLDYFTNPVEINGKHVYNKPDIIYCFNKHDGLNRSKQLMQPLIDSGIVYNIESNNDKKGTEQMVDDLFNDKNKDLTLLVCWEHTIIPDLVQMIGKKISGNKNIYKKFKYWSTDPAKGKHGESDNSLYSLTVVIDPLNHTLRCVNQSDNFNKACSLLKKADKYQIGFTI